MKCNIPAGRFSVFFTVFLFITSISGLSKERQADTLDPWSVSEEELLRYLRTEERLYDQKERAKMQAEQYSQQQGMSLQRYYEIARMVNEEQNRSNYSEKELRIAEKISAKIQEINDKLPEQSKNIMHQEDFTPERYEQLSQAIEDSAELQRRIDKLVEFFSL